MPAPKPEDGDGVGLNSMRLHQELPKGATVVQTPDMAHQGKLSKPQCLL